MLNLSNAKYAQNQIEENKTFRKKGGVDDVQVLWFNHWNHTDTESRCNTKTPNERMKSKKKLKHMMSNERLLLMPRTHKTVHNKQTS